MELSVDLAVVGGGLNGTALALAAAQAGLSVALIEARAPTAPGQDFDGRGYALALTSRRLLAALGVWGAVLDEAQPMLDIKVSDGRAGEGPSPFFMHFNHAEIDEGPMGYMVEDRHLRPALLAAVKAEPAITHRVGHLVTTQRPGSGTISLTLDGGNTVRAALVAGCDGRDSGTAARAGIRRMTWDYAQTALVCAIAHERPHEGTAHQFFMAPGPIAILPLKGNRSSIVWTETTVEAARISTLDDPGYLDMLRPRFGDFLGDIALAGARFSYPLGLSLAHDYVAERVVLVGDAAHGIHPIAGQGLNAGLRDVAALAEVLSNARARGEDIGALDVLHRYRQWRRFDNTALAMATDGFNRLFSNDNSLMRGLRDLGLGAVGALPGLRRGFIREAAGLTGQLPRLMQGRPQ